MLQDVVSKLTVEGVVVVEQALGSSRRLDVGFSPDRRRFLNQALALGAVMAGARVLSGCTGDAVDEERVNVPAPKEGNLPAHTGGERYQGMELTVSTLAGPVGRPMHLFKGDWEKATGARVRLLELPFGDIHAKYRSSLATRTHVADIMDFGADFSGDIMGGGFLLAVPEWVRQRLDWDDVLGPYRERILNWGGTQFATPYDGDTTSLFYRKDVLAQPDVQRRFQDSLGTEPRPPTTWDEALQIAKLFSGWDWSGRGRPSHGMALQAKPNDSAYFFFPAIAATFTKVPGEEASIYFSTEDFSPLVNNEGWVRALEVWTELTSYAPPGVLNSGFAEVRAQFVGQEAFMAMDWADMGTLSYDPRRSQVRGNVGFALVPGSTEVFNYKTGQWQDVPEGNNAPFLAWNGWAAGVPTTTEPAKRQACFDFLTYMASKEISIKSVVTPDSGINPWRRSHTENLDAWVAGSRFQRQQGIPNGFPTEQDAQEYLDTQRSVYEHPNVVPDLRVPGAFDYFTALDKSIAPVVAGDQDAKEGLDQAAQEFERITESLGGVEKQLDFYRDSLGI